MCIHINLCMFMQMYFHVRIYMYELQRSGDELDHLVCLYIYIYKYIHVIRIYVDLNMYLTFMFMYMYICIYKYVYIGEEM
jgi:hypothetical protein